MQIEKYKIESFDTEQYKAQQQQFDLLVASHPNIEAVVQKLIDFQIAIPSWALGTGDARFGRFGGGGEPRSLEEKIEDVGLLHALNACSGAISLHIHAL